MCGYPLPIAILILCSIERDERSNQKAPKKKGYFLRIKEEFQKIDSFLASFRFLFDDFLLSLLSSFHPLFEWHSNTTIQKQFPQFKGSCPFFPPSLQPFLSLQFNSNYFMSASQKSGEKTAHLIDQSSSLLWAQCHQITTSPPFWVTPKWAVEFASRRLSETVPWNLWERKSLKRWGNFYWLGEGRVRHTIG